MNEHSEINVDFSTVEESNSFVEFAFFDLTVALTEAQIFLRLHSCFL